MAFNPTKLVDLIMLAQEPLEVLDLDVHGVVALTRIVGQEIWSTYLFRLVETVKQLLLLSLASLVDPVLSFLLSL